MTMPVCIPEIIAAIEAAMAHHRSLMAQSRSLMAQSRSLMAQRRSLMAELDTLSVAIGRPWARDSATIFNGTKAKDEDEALSRMHARILEALSAAGITFELRYLGAPLH